MYGHTATSKRHIFKTHLTRENEKINSEEFKMHVSSLCHFGALKFPVVFLMNSVSPYVEYIDKEPKPGFTSVSLHFFSLSSYKPSLEVNL